MIDLASMDSPGQPLEGDLTSRALMHVVGDIAFSHDSTEAWIDEEVREALSSGLSVGNLECVLVDERYTGDGLVVHGHSRAAQYLRDANIRVVSLANNHIRDLNEDGIVSTQRALDDAGIAYFGAGLTETEALEPLILEEQGIRMGFIGRQDPISHPPPGNIYAEGDQAGPARFVLSEALETGRALRDQGCEVTVCYLHWGIQKVPFLPDWLIEATRELLEVFDVVAGSHAHTLYPCWRDQDGVALTGLGNFYFAPLMWQGELLYSKPALDRLAVIASIDLGGQGVSRVDLIPTRQGLGEHYTVGLLGGLSRSLVRFFLERIPPRSTMLFRCAWRIHEVRGWGRYVRAKGFGGIARHLNWRLPAKIWSHLVSPRSR
jgi:hypothetical protein